MSTRAARCPGFRSLLRMLRDQAVVLGLATALAAAAAERPRIGLVLGGGGARGAAHLGVLEELERLRVPVDCVAGTSMGALVAGAWVAGRTRPRCAAAMQAADWADMFVDGTNHADLDLRSRRLQQRFLPGTETGITAAGAISAARPGAGPAHQAVHQPLVRAETGEPRLESLPLPLSLLATDIGTGARVVLREGSLPEAMRASMAVPGLLAPLNWQGRKLVDGGLVDNLPVREVRDRCGAEVVIAVNVGSPPLAADAITGLLSITAQMVALLTEQNVVASLASLTPRDLLIRPDLGDITAADFERHAEAAERGRHAVREHEAALAALALPAREYAAWQRATHRREGDVPRVDAIEVLGLSRVAPEVLLQHVQQRAGAPLDVEQLSQDLVRAYADGHYERVDYAVRRETGPSGRRSVLELRATEKSWGPDYLRLGLQLQSTLSQGSGYQLRAALQRTWLNRRGAELLVAGEIGDASGLELQFTQPLDMAQRVFVDARTSYRRARSDYFLGGQRIAEYRQARRDLELGLGRNLVQLGQLRAAAWAGRSKRELETGLDLFSGLPALRGRGWLLEAELDRMDRLYFPRDGWSTSARWRSDERQGWHRLALEGRAVGTWGDWVVGTRASWTGTTRGQLPLEEAPRLGGFLHLTGYATGQLIGEDIGYAHVRAERIIGRLPLGLRGDMRFGLALEAGRVGTPYTLQKRDGTLGGLALYLGGETPLGSVYVGLGRAAGGAFNAYLFLGTP
jgi:NTE family protein